MGQHCFYHFSVKIVFVIIQLVLEILYMVKKVQTKIHVQGKIHIFSKIAVTFELSMEFLDLEKDNFFKQTCFERR